MEPADVRMSKADLLNRLLELEKMARELAIIVENAIIDDDRVGGADSSPAEPIRQP